MTDPIDVYSEWVDETEAVNRAAIDEGNPSAAISNSHGAGDDELSDDQHHHDDEIARRQERHRNSNKVKSDRHQASDDDEGEAVESEVSDEEQ